MTQEQILREFESLPRQEQESVARTIFERLHLLNLKKHQADSQSKRRDALARLRGALQWPGSPPTDAEVRQFRDEYLIRKYQ